MNTQNTPSTSTDDCCANAACGQSTSPAAAPSAALTTTMLHVPDMCCAGEYKRIEAQLKQLPEIRDSAPNYAQRLVRVRHSGTSDAAVLAMAQTAGFAVNLAKPTPAGLSAT